jgi:DNA polymerase-3 subunit gamma/tau
MMATTELHKVPETIQSRAQVFDFRTIPTRTIADALRRVADAERLAIDDAALAMIAREAEGSMRDAQSALDQVIAFAGDRITAEDVSTVLGLVGRDLLLDVVEAVADEDAGAIFALAARAVEAGHDPGRICRDLSFVARDLLLISVDPGRADDPEVAPEHDRERLQSLAKRFSREDLLRAFDVLSDAATEIKTAAQPRYHLEMALVRWAHLRKLVPLTDIIDQLGGTERSKSPGPKAPGSGQPGVPPRQASQPTRPAVTPPQSRREAVVPPPQQDPPAAAQEQPADLKEAILGEARAARKALYELSLAKARRITLDGDRLVFGFAADQRMHQQQLESNREWLETLATRLAGRKITIATTREEGDAQGAPAASASPPPDDRKARLKAEALSDAGVQAMLDVFGGEIRDVEEM